MAKLIRAVNKMVIDENSNTLICEHKLAFKFFLTFGIMAFALKKKENSRTFDINQISEIKYKSSPVSGNTITFKVNDTIQVFEMTSKADFLNCVDFLKTTKLSSLISE